VAEERKGSPLHPRADPRRWPPRRASPPHRDTDDWTTAPFLLPRFVSP
jgi:hypothetical protein